MKLIIQIPCFNEEGTLATTLKALPKRVAGFDTVEALVIDDGSSDQTVAVARQEGVAHILPLPHRGLAHAFSRGLQESVRLGADVIVHTDADNQYCADDIPALVAPIVEKRAQIVVGCRAIDSIDHFSPLKKSLQRWGSRVVRQLSRLEISDATSGFRAYTREAALRLNVLSDYTYTLETLIQAGQRGISVVAVPIRTNPKLRESRLIKSTWGYVFRSAATMVRVYLMYQPFKSFLTLGGVVFAAGGGLVVRFLVFHLTRPHSGHVQSLVLGVGLLILGLGVAMLGLLADLIAANRKLQEETLYHLKRQALNLK